MPLNPNDILQNGQYRVLRQLGRGGFGFVYQAQDTLLHDQVAIKELIPALVGDETTLKRFLAEARATMRLANDHLVRTHNVFQEGGNYYIVMECMSGGSLEDRLREVGSLPVGEAVRIAAEVCAGLDYAHHRGIVHCDLKPANILFTADGAAKVADFGIAHVPEQVLSRSWMTPAGFAAGTLPYMSPEQADGVREDPRVDVYAMGAVLYRMLTGRTYLKFDQRETPGAQADNVYRIRNAQPDSPSAHNRRLPAWLDEVVLKALSKRPDERYGSAAEMGAALGRQGVASAVPPQPRASVAAALSSPRPTQRPAWFWPAVGAVGVLLIVISVALAMLFGAGPVPAENRTPEPTQGTLVEPEAISALLPSHTPPPPTSTSTATDIPTRSLPPTATRVPLPTLPPPSPASQALPSPSLVSPASGSELQGMVTFAWTYPGTLASDEAFQVLIWEEDSSLHLGAAQSWGRTEQLIDLEHVPQVIDGGTGLYYWSVVVVQKGTDQRLSAEAVPRRFTYLGPAGTPTPAPLALSHRQLAGRSVQRALPSLHTERVAWRPASETPTAVCLCG